MQQPKCSDVPHCEGQERLQQKNDEWHGLKILLDNHFKLSISLSKMQTQAADAITRLRSESISQRRGYKVSSEGRGMKTLKHLLA